MKDRSQEKWKERNKAGRYLPQPASLHHRRRRFRLLHCRRLARHGRHRRQRRRLVGLTMTGIQNTSIDVPDLLLEFVQVPRGLRLLVRQLFACEWRKGAMGVQKHTRATRAARPQGPEGGRRRQCGRTSHRPAGGYRTSPCVRRTTDMPADSAGRTTWQGQRRSWMEKGSTTTALPRRRGGGGGAGPWRVVVDLGLGPHREVPVSQHTFRGRLLLLCASEAGSSGTSGSRRGWRRRQAQVR